MANTYTLIASNTLSSTATSVAFNSIPQTYTDLCLKLSTRGDVAGSYSTPMHITVNSIATGDFSQTGLIENVSSASAVNQTGNAYISPQTSGMSAGNTTNLFSTNEIYFNLYTSSNYKSFLIRGSDLTSYQGIEAVLMQNTAAISSLTVENMNGNFIVGCTFDLYGIKN